MTRRRRRRRGRRIQCCIKDNNTLYQNEISTLRRLMLADIHDTPCKTLCRVYSNTMSAPKFYGTERSAPTIPYFLRPNIVFKIRAIIRRVLSLRALLLRKYPILEREGKKKKKRKERKKKSQWNDGQFSTRNSFLLWPLPLFLPGPPAWERSFFFPFVAERRANYPRKYVESAGYSSRSRSIDRNNPPTPTE